MKIVIPDKLQILESDKNKLVAYADIKIYDDVINDPKVIIDRIKDAEIITANYIDITAEIINNSPNLKYIIAPAVGYDWIDVKTASERKIKVINCPTFNTYAVAEHALGLIFAVYKRIVEAQRSILAGKWEPLQLMGHELKGKNLLTIGYGNIGKSIHILAKGLGMNVNYTNSKTSLPELELMLQNNDIIVICCPLNDHTRGLFDKHKISLLKNSAILINVARGPIVDQEALYQALVNKNILGAGLDVFNNDNTLAQPREDILKFAQLANVVTTPHIAYNTHETVMRFGTELMTNIDAIQAGNPVNIVN